MKVILILLLSSLTAVTYAQVKEAGNNKIEVSAVAAKPNFSSVDIKISVFLNATRLKCQPERGLIDNKKYLIFRWEIDDKLMKLPRVEGEKIFTAMADIYNLYINDFILRDSMREYTGVIHFFNSEKSIQEYKLTYDFTEELISKFTATKEYYSLETKAKMFLSLSTKDGGYNIDSVHKTISFKGDISWKSQSVDYARYVYAYILRNRHYIDRIEFMFYEDEKRKHKPLYCVFNDKDDYFDDLRMGIQ